MYYIAIMHRANEANKIFSTSSKVMSNIIYVKCPKASRVSFQLYISATAVRSSHRHLLLATVNMVNAKLQHIFKKLTIHGLYN